MSFPLTPSPSLSLKQSPIAIYWEKKKRKKACFFSGLSQPSTFADASSLMLAKVGDKYPAVKKGSDANFTQLRPSSKVSK